MSKSLAIISEGTGKGIDIQDKALDCWYKTRTAMLLFALLLAPCSGCGNKHSLAPVEGKVLLEGNPITGGKVLLTPTFTGKPVSGIIQPDGSFVLTTYQKNDGARPGKYRLMIVGDRHSKNKQAKTSWMAPMGTFIEIEAGKDNHLSIEVKPSDGWKPKADD